MDSTGPLLGLESTVSADWQSSERSGAGLVLSVPSLIGECPLSNFLDLFFGTGDGEWCNTHGANPLAAEESSWYWVVFGAGDARLLCGSLTEAEALLIEEVLGVESG